MRYLFRYIFVVLLLVGYAIGQACPSTGWCQIYSSVPPGFHSEGWNEMSFSPDTDLLYLLASNGGGITPESNSFWSYHILNPPSVPITTNPWTEVSTCGDKIGVSDGTQVNRQSVHLAASITSTTGTCSGGCTDADNIHLALNSGNIVTGVNALYAGNTTNGSGVIWIGNEAVRYGKCTSSPTFSSSVCSTSSGPDMYLWGTSNGTATGTQAPLTRGTRQTAGWSAAVGHLGGVSGTGEAAGWACYNPALGANWNYSGSPTSITGTDHDTGVSRAGSWDHPGERHAVQNEPYDTKRGRIWAEFGFEENWQWQDTWSLCVANKGGAGGGDALSICGAGDVYTATVSTKGWQRIAWPGTNPATPLYTFATSGPGYNIAITENASEYDPVEDVIVEMGGLGSGSARNEILIFCMTASSTAWGCAGQPAGTWVKLVPSVCSGSTPTTGHYCGNTGTRDGARLAWDSVNNRMDAFGGVCTGSLFSCVGGLYYWNTVAQYDVVHGDVVLSDATGANATNGSANSTRTGTFTLPAISGTPPPQSESGLSAQCGSPAGTQNCILKFPAWSYVSNSSVSKFAYYGGNQGAASDGIWLYNPTTNAWSQAAVSGGPTIALSLGCCTSHSNMAYNATDNTLVWEQGGDSATKLWQLPGASLAASGPIPSLSPGSFNFGTFLVGTTSGANAFTLSNSSGASGNLTSISVSITGTNSSNFAISANTCGATLTPGSSCSISVTFTPSATGTRTASLQVTDNVGTQSSSLTGTGQSSAPIASLSPSTLTFASQNVGTSSASQAITLTNTGSANLTWTTLLGFVGTNSGDFSQTNSCTSPLTASASCTVNVTFTPTAAGARSASITFTDNASGSPQSVPLSGTGANPNPWSTMKRGTTMRR